MSGQTILVLEDEPLIAMDIGDTLEAMGYEVILAPALADAVRHARLDNLAFAILDYIVDRDHGTSAAVAAVLRERGIPFAICSGEDPTKEEEFAGVPFLAKPFNTEGLEALIKAAHAPSA